VSSVPEPFEKFSGEFSLADLTVFFDAIAESRTADIDGLIPVEEEFEAYLSELRAESFMNEVDASGATNGD
jgi:hypothetical protein